MTNLNLTKTSFSKKDIKANLVALNINEQEISLALNKINKTMIGKAEAVTIIVHTCISYYQDDTGLDYTVDQLLVDLEAKLGKTFTFEVFNTVLREIWTAVHATLEQYPKGHTLIKSVLKALNKEFYGKTTMGIKQVREAVYIATLEAYMELV